MLFNFTLIDKLMIQYHSRGQAKILASSNNVYITNFPSYGRYFFPRSRSLGFCSITISRTFKSVTNSDIFRSALIS